MSFHNPLLLAGLAAAVLPIVLHLLGRANARSVGWSAMMFLGNATGNTAAGRLRDRALLGIRCLAIATFALALARPTAGGTDANEASNAVVLVIDASPSTLHPEQNTTRFELARRAALDRLGQLRQGDQAGLVALGTAGPADIALTPDLQAVASQVASLATGALPADLAEGERRARAMLADSGIEGGEIQLIADRQRTTWEPLRQPAMDAPSGPRLIAMPVGSDAHHNTSIDAVELLNPPAIAGAPARFAITLRNDSPVPQGALQLRITPGRGVPFTGTVAVDAHARMTVVRTVVPERAGPTTVTVSLPSTGMPDDDTVRLSLDVISPPRVHRVAADEATTRPVHPFRDVDIAVVNDTLPNADTLAALEHFVAGGGGLLLAPGPTLTPAAWNQTLWKNGFGLAPAAAADVRAGSPAIPTAVPRFAIPPADASDWTTAAVTRFWQLMPGGTETVVGRIGQAPIVIERGFGRGRVAIVAVPIDGRWTVEGRTSTYDGLVGVLITRLMKRPPDRNVDLGIPLEMTLGLPRDRTASVQRPDGRYERVTLTVAADQAVLRYARTDVPGRYTVRVADQPAVDWYVRADPAESDLSLLNDAALADVLRGTGIELRPNAERPASVEREWTSLVLAAAGLLLALEVAMAGGYLPRRGHP